MQNETKVCKHCQTEIPKKAKVCPNCRKKQGGILKWIIVVIVAIAVISSFAGGDDEKGTDSNPNNKLENPTVESDIKKEEDNNIPTEYKTALKKAKSYSDTMHMSKARLYDQLTSEYGEKYSAEAAQYAVDNVDADWNYNALKSAENYSKTMHMSKQGIYDQLTSDAGEKFSAEEAQYAIDNVKADWKENALKKAKSYQESMNMSPAAIRDQLVSEYGEKFTEEEADYAISNLK